VVTLRFESWAWLNVASLGAWLVSSDKISPVNCHAIYCKVHLVGHHAVMFENELRSMIAYLTFLGSFQFGSSLQLFCLCLSSKRSQPVQLNLSRLRLGMLLNPCWKNNVKTLDGG